MTLISGMRLGAVVAPFAFAGATDTPAFQTYAEAVFGAEVAQRRRGHLGQPEAAQERGGGAGGGGAGAAGAARAAVEPDLIPIEKMFSKVKEALRTLAARTTESLMERWGSAAPGLPPGYPRLVPVLWSGTRSRPETAQGPPNRLKSGECALPSWEAV